MRGTGNLDRGHASEGRELEGGGDGSLPVLLQWTEEVHGQLLSGAQLTIAKCRRRISLFTAAVRCELGLVLISCLRIVLSGFKPVVSGQPT